MLQYGAHCSVPEEEEFNMELHTLIARELTGTGNTGRERKGEKEEREKE